MTSRRRVGRRLCHPWITNELGFDPAAASAPLITTVEDVTALLL